MSSRGIVMLPGNAPPITCGIGDYTARLAQELRQLGVPTETWTRVQDGVVPGAHLHTPAATIDKTGIEAFAARLQAECPAVLHLQYEADTYNNNGFALLRFAIAAKKAGAALVTTFHALDGPRPWKKLHRLALIPGFLASRDIVVCSKRQQDALIKFHLGAKTHLIPVGTSVPITGKRSPRPANAPLHLVYFGFVWRGRNIETCVRALAETNKKTPAKLTIMGGIRDAAYRKEIEALAASLGVADRITFTNDIPAPEISQLLADADVALLPFGPGVSTGRTTFVAAIDHGLPVVTMGSPDNLVPEFQNNVNMVYVAPDDTDGFVRETVRVAIDSNLRKTLSANTPALARYFSWEEIARKTANLPSYRAALAQRDSVLCAP